MSVPREPKAPVSCVDQYGASYREVLPEVRSVASCTALHRGLLAALPRQTLPALARAVGGDDAHACPPLWTHAPWEVVTLRQRRLALIKSV
jgi:SRSO17 transposase